MLFWHHVYRVYVQQAKLSTSIVGRPGLMSYQYNYNHFEPYYGYPWMPVVAPGRCHQDRPSPLHTAADGGNEPSCSSTKTTNHYTVALKIFSPLNSNIHCVILILRLYLYHKSSRKREVCRLEKLFLVFKSFPSGFIKKLKDVDTKQRRPLRCLGTTGEE